MQTPAYGVLKQTASESTLNAHLEDLSRDGFTIVEGVMGDDEIREAATAFDAARARYVAEMGGNERLARLDEHNGVRLPLVFDQRLIAVAMNPHVMELCRAVLGDYFILNQQNSVINPPSGEKYNQGKWHRDLPYQHVVFSRPIMINALYCVDDFTAENGATLVLPGTHLHPNFPSDRYVAQKTIKATAPAGSFIVLDGMTYHSGGVNETTRPRRAVNHVYSIPQLSQQISIGAIADDWDLAPYVRKFLGLEVQTPNSIDEFLERREYGARSN